MPTTKIQVFLWPGQQEYKMKNKNANKKSIFPPRFRKSHSKSEPKKLDLKIPTTWNQLTAKQLLFVCKQYQFNLNNFKFKLYVFLKLAAIKALPRKIVNNKAKYLFRKKRVRFSLTIEELHSFLKSVDFLTTESQLTKNNFPKFTILARHFYGPSTKGYNITFLEFLNAEATLYAFHKSRKQKYLRQLCAILYRPQTKNYNPKSPDFNGDRREKFNDFIYQKRIWLFRFLSKQKQYAVYLFYIGCRNALIKAHPELFPASTVSSEQTNPVENLKKTMRALNLGDVTKNKQIEQTQIWSAFAQLEDMVKQTKPKK